MFALCCHTVPLPFEYWETSIFNPSGKYSNTFTTSPSFLTNLILPVIVPFTLVVAEFTCMNLEASDKLVSEIKKSAPFATVLPLFVRVKLFISNSIWSISLVFKRPILTCIVSIFAFPATS